MGDAEYDVMDAVAENAGGSDFDSDR